MKRLSAIALCLVLLAFAFAVVSCGNEEASETAGRSPVGDTGMAPEQPTGDPEPTDDAEPVTVGIITNAIAPFWDPMVVGMDRAAADPTASPEGSPIDLAALWADYDGGTPPCEASWKGPDQGTLQEQRRLIEEYEATGVDAISISPRESGPLTDTLDGLIDSGMTVLCMDSDAPDSKRLAYIGTNNFEAGRMAGEAAGKVFGDGGAKLIGFVGDLAAENAKQRIEGFKEAAAQYNIELVDVRQDDADPAKARRNAEDAIQAYSDIDGFLGIWSYDAPAIAQAVIDAGKQEQIKIISFDAEPLTLQHLEKGEIEATVVQKPYLFGYLSVQLAYAVEVLGEEKVREILPEGGVIDTGVTVVTPENIGEFTEYLDDLGVESS